MMNRRLPKTVSPGPRGGFLEGVRIEVLKGDDIASENRVCGYRVWCQS
jgi:hypothetical protein